MSQRSGNAPVTLLPFLAVLICTMGALIVLLVVVVQQARVAGNDSETAQADPIPLVHLPGPDDVIPEAVEVESNDDGTAPHEAEESNPPPWMETSIVLDESALPAAEELELDTAMPHAALQEPADTAVTEKPAPAATPTPAGPTAEEVARAQQERDKYLWEIQLLEEAQQNTQQRLSEKNLELSHLEEHTRRLVAELEQLQETADQATSAHAVTMDQAPSAELPEIEQKVAAKQAELDALRAAVANQRATYRLVPYNGSQGTTRRPIYVECRADTVVIQPEGVHLTPEDFALPTNSGNPLAAALRAVREYWATLETDAKRGEPYPLLIVRPGGEKAYALCRRAMKSWDNEFGYELVSNDMPLDYPEADAAVAETIQHALETAREQQRHMLALVAATRPNQGPIYRASRSGGGFVREGGTASRTRLAQPRDEVPPKSSAPAGNGLGGPNPKPTSLGNPDPQSNDAIDLANGQPGAQYGVDATALAIGGGGFQPESATSSPEREPLVVTAEAGMGNPASAFVLPDEFLDNGTSTAVGGPGGDISGPLNLGDTVKTLQDGTSTNILASREALPPGESSAAGENIIGAENTTTGHNLPEAEEAAALTGVTVDNADDGASNDANHRGKPSNTSVTPDNGASNFADVANALSDARSQPADDNATSFESNAADSNIGEPQNIAAGLATSPQSVGGPDSQPSSAAATGAGQPQQDIGAQPSLSAITSLAETRGEDWALPNAVQGAIPIERPVFVAVNHAQLVLEAEPGTSQVPAVLTFQLGTRAAVQTLVTKIWQRIDSWGVAGPGVYWRPKLSMTVSPDGEAIYAELKVLLRNSGLQLERN